MKILLKKVSFAIGILFCFMNVLCETGNVDSDYSSFCDVQVVIDENQYQNLEPTNFKFINAEIIDNCLNIEIGASGCDGNTWEFNLVDSGVIAESLPEQRYLKFQLINNELCLAYFERTILFDLTPLQINGSNEITLHVEGFESSLNYKY